MWHRVCQRVSRAWWRFYELMTQEIEVAIRLDYALLIALAFLMLAWLMRR